MPFAPEEIEDGTGLATALVYESPEVVAAWLSRRGMTGFASASDGVQQAALIRATETAETEAKQWVRSFPVSDHQHLIFPAFGAYLSNGHLIDEDEVPEDYRIGIRLLAEAAAVAGGLMPNAGSLPIEAESSKRGSITYRRGTDFSSLGVNHPEAWKKISTVIPPL